MFYKIIFILIIAVLCLMIYKNLHEDDRDVMYTFVQIGVVGVVSLIFLDVRTLVLFVLLVLLSFLAKEIIKKIFGFSSRRKIKIIKSDYKSSFKKFL